VKSLHKNAYGLTLAAAIVASSLIFTTASYAVDSELQVQITPMDCSVDQVHDGISSTTVTTPASCSEPVSTGATGQAISNTAGASESVANTSTNTAYRFREAESPSILDRNGDQQTFEGTVFEPLASILGVGNPQASPASPVVAASTFGFAAAFAVDTALFKRRFSQAVITNGRRAFSGAQRVLRRLISRV